MEVLKILKDGICPGWNTIPQLQSIHRPHEKEDEKLALEIIKEYLLVGAVKEVEMGEKDFLIPWFVISKIEGRG